MSVGRTAEPAAVVLPKVARERDTALPGDRRWSPYLYVLPALGFYLCFVLAPALHTVGLSFFAWDGITSPVFSGLDNYRALFGDTEIRQAFVHGFVLVLFFSVLPVAIALVLAGALARIQVRGQTAFRTVLFLPQVVSMVAIAVIWRWIYDFDGPLNAVLRAVGLEGLSRAWLGDFSTALPALGLVGTWVAIGLCLVLFLAGAQRIPQSLYDAARVDGAGPVREFFAVTFPNLRNEIVVALALTIIAALRTFDLIFMTTRGGPGRETSVPALEIYNRAFVFGQVGAAAAIATALALVIALTVLVVTRIGERRVS